MLVAATLPGVTCLFQQVSSRFALFQLIIGQDPSHQSCIWRAAQPCSGISPASWSQRGADMDHSTLILLGGLAVWFILQTWLLPRLGVPT